MQSELILPDNTAMGVITQWAWIHPEKPTGTWQYGSWFKLAAWFKRLPSQNAFSGKCVLSNFLSFQTIIPRTFLRCSACLQCSLKTQSSKAGFSSLFRILTGKLRIYSNPIWLTTSLYTLLKVWSINIEEFNIHLKLIIESSRSFASCSFCICL